MARFLNNSQKKKIKQLLNQETTWFWLIRTMTDLELQPATIHLPLLLSMAGYAWLGAYEPLKAVKEHEA